MNLLSVVIETCFEMQKTQKTKIFDYFQVINPPNFKHCSEVKSAEPPISYKY